MKTLFIGFTFIFSINASAVTSESWILVDSSEKFEFVETFNQCSIVKTGFKDESQISMHLTANDFVFRGTFRVVDLQFGNNAISPIRIDEIVFTVLNGGPSLSGKDCKINLQLFKEDMTGEFDCTRLNNSLSPFKSTLKGSLSCVYRNY